MSLLVEQVILIIALLIFFLGKALAIQGTIQLCRAQQGLGGWGGKGGEKATKKPGNADPKAVTSSCDFNIWKERRCL